VRGISLGIDADSIIGRAVIVHENADDLETQPSGNSGPRLACGVIGRRLATPSGRETLKAR